jgi:3-oxoacyl-[acyl-carrier-protein] synthase II
MGEGAAVVILEELTHAQKRNAPTYAEVIGYGATMQGRTLLYEKELLEARVEGIAACVEEAIAHAKIDPQDIDYLNAEGNATPLSDWVETEAIKKVFGRYASQLSISSTKATMGHLLSASGPAEVIIGTLAIRDGIIPPTINYQHPDPYCDLDYTPNYSKEKEVEVVLSLSLGLNGENVALLIRKFS